VQGFEDAAVVGEGQMATTRCAHCKTRSPSQDWWLSANEIHTSSHPACRSRSSARTHDCAHPGHRNGVVGDLLGGSVADGLWKSNFQVTHDGYGVTMASCGSLCTRYFYSWESGYVTASGNLGAWGYPDRYDKPFCKWDAIGSGSSTHLQCEYDSA